MNWPLEALMPRRSPGEIRSRLPRRIPRSRLAATYRRPPVIRGLSPSANRQIADFERARGLAPGTVARAFSRWASTRRHSSRDPSPDYEHDDLRSIDHHVRTLLEHAIWTLRPRARRELRRQLGPPDDRATVRTVNDPFAPPDLPWWKRRIET